MIFNFRDTKDAKTLEGHEAEYFVDRGQSLRASILDKALEVGNGVHHFIFSGSNTPADDLPNGAYRYGSATVIKRGAGSITVIAWGSTNNSYIHFLPKFNYYNNGTWTGWKGLDDFLPLTGGVIGDGTKRAPVTVKGNTGALTKYTKSDDSILGYIGISSGGKPVFQGSDNVERVIIHNGNYSDYVLSKDGGNVNSLTIANNEALHTGNSAKTIISDVAPSDINAVWIDVGA